jgi:hypothetical protein
LELHLNDEFDNQEMQEAIAIEDGQANRQNPIDENKVWDACAAITKADPILAGNTYATFAMTRIMVKKLENGMGFEKSQAQARQELNQFADGPGHQCERLVNSGKKV